MKPYEVTGVFPLFWIQIYGELYIRVEPNRERFRQKLTSLRHVVTDHLILLTLGKCTVSCDLCHKAEAT